MNTTICKIKKKINIDTILIAIIINANVFRYIIGSSREFLLYFFYIGCFLILWKNNKGIRRLLKHHNDLKIFYALSFSLLIYALLSFFWLPFVGYIFLYLKLVLSFLIVAYIPIIVEAKIIRIVIISMIINIIYSGYILLYPDRTDYFIDGGNNYLNATLTLGLMFTFSLISIFYYFINRKVFIVLLWIGIMMLILSSLLNFSARGVLIFPPIIFFILLPIVGRGSFFKTMIMYVIGGIFIFLSIDYFVENNSGYTLYHMVRLFENTEDESRIEIWSKSLSYMTDNYWFLLGGGLDSFKNSLSLYPHNFILQVIGEYGLIGLLWIAFFIIVSFRSIFDAIRDKGRTNIVFYYVIGGFLYYFLTFSKSFSFYDSLPLLIFFMFCISISDRYQKKVI